MNILKLLAFMGSRKVGFGLYLFLVANAFLVYKLISSDQWFTCVALCSALIGGGSIADRYLESKKAAPPTNG